MFELSNIVPFAKYTNTWATLQRIQNGPFRGLGTNMWGNPVLREVWAQKWRLFPIDSQETREIFFFIVLIFVQFLLLMYVTVCDYGL